MPRNLYHRTGKRPGGLILTTTKSGTFAFSLRGSGTVTVDWGDGSETDDYILQPTSVSCSHDYGDGSSKNVTITGDVSGITYILISSQSITNTNLSFLSYISPLAYTVYITGNPGEISSLAPLSRFADLTSLYINNNSLMATNLSPLSELDSLINLMLYSNSGLGGDVSHLPYSSISVLRAYGTSISCVSTVPPWSGAEVRFDSCGWTSTEVDNFLIQAAISEVTGCTINIAGTNAVRTSDSDAALATLEGAPYNNTVTVNE